MEWFQYKPIDLEGRSFRLVRLLKAEFGPVQCELFDAWLDDECLEYDALSYTWGGTYKPHEIEMNGKMMPVTKNLSLALKSLRYPHQDRIIWIDAVCIDQDNDKERGHQVSQMTLIYKKAEQVVIWLGSATKLTDAIFDYMSELEKETLNYACRDWRTSDERWLSIGQHVMSTTSSRQRKLASPSLQRMGLCTVLNRPWFDRVWIIQEVASARAARVVCGMASVSARTFALAPMLVGYEPESHRQAILDVMPGPSRKYSWWTQKHDLHTLLIKFKGSQASEARDKVFALLGISSDGLTSDAPRPDYEKSELEVTQGIIAFLLGLDCEAICLPEWTMTRFLENVDRLGNEILMWAAETGVGTTVEALLRSGKVQTDYRGQDGRTPLLLAVERADLEVVRLLLEIGMADINLGTKNGPTPLMLALKLGYPAITKLLLEKGEADISDPTPDGQTPLLLAAQSGDTVMVKRLLETGVVDETREDLFGWTALWLAAINGYDTIVQMLFDCRSANPGDWRHSQDEALQGHKLLARAMLEIRGGGKSANSWPEQTPLWWAADNKHSTVVRLLFETGNAQVHRICKSDERLFVWLAHNGFEKELRWLLGAAKAYLVETGQQEWASRLITWAFKNQHGTLISILIDSETCRASDEGQLLREAAETGSQAIVKQLLDTGRVDVNFEGRSSGEDIPSTPLWEATRRGHTAVVKLLLEEPAVQVNWRSRYHRYMETPLETATRCGHLAIINLLPTTNRVSVRVQDNGHPELAQPLRVYRDRSRSVKWGLCAIAVAVFWGWNRRWS